MECPITSCYWVLLWFKRFFTLCPEYYCYFDAYRPATAKHQAAVVQMLDSAIHQINHYPLDSEIGFPNTYPLDSDLSSG